MDEHPKLRLREQLRTVIRTLRYSHRTEQAYWHWIRGYIRFHQLRHPLEMAEREVREYLTWLAIHRNVAGCHEEAVFYSEPYHSHGSGSSLRRTFALTTAIEPFAITFTRAASRRR